MVKGAFWNIVVLALALIAAIDLTFGQLQNNQGRYGPRRRAIGRGGGGQVVTMGAPASFNQAQRVGARSSDPTGLVTGTGAVTGTGDYTILPYPNPVNPNPYPYPYPYPNYPYYPPGGYTPPPPPSRSNPGINTPLDTFLNGASFTTTLFQITRFNSTETCYNVQLPNVISLPRFLMPQQYNPWQNTLCGRNYFVEVTNQVGRRVIVKPKYVIDTGGEEIAVDQDSYAYLTVGLQTRNTPVVSYRLYGPIPTLY